MIELASYSSVDPAAMHRRDHHDHSCLALDSIEQLSTKRRGCSRTAVDHQTRSATNIIDSLKTTPLVRKIENLPE
ncbi:hypothetical protein GE061_008971 [Apolygus lucorum]|uniref:Uncharacterized protein n=1 Tax=Apolygus lucorum TaxID=248454 RepID=A0A8S9XYV4_APOLU|nr:hypothetical protein GE061_008971 [Apolygus lucorum]